jgi:hypothetical protein
MASNAIRPSPAAVFRPLETGGVILNVESGAYFELNPSGCFLWEQLETGADQDSIATAVAERYEIDLPTARADVADFLEDLRKRQLVEE